MSDVMWLLYEFIYKRITQSRQINETDDDDETYKISVIYVIKTILKMNAHLIAYRLFLFGEQK